MAMPIRPTRKGWTPPAARIEGDRLLRARQAQQRGIDAVAARVAATEQEEREEQADLVVKVDHLNEKVDRLFVDIPKIIPAGGGGKRMVAKVLDRDFPGLGDLPENAALKANNLSDLSDTAQARENLAVPTFVATRTAMLALNTAKDRVAYLTEAPLEGIHDWDGSDLNAKVADASQTTTSINSGTDVITLASHGLLNSQGVIALSAVNGLSLNTVYWVHKIDANTFTLHSNIYLGVSGLTPINLTGTTNFSFRRLKDPEKRIYVTPATDLSGASGAWVRRGAAVTGSGFEDALQGDARMHKFADRAMFGDAVNYDGRTSSFPTTNWLFYEGAGTVPMSYLLNNAGVAAVYTSYTDGSTAFSSGGTAILGAIRNGGIGISAYASSGVGAGCDAMYMEAVRKHADTGCLGIEINATNIYADDAAPTNPYQGASPDAVIGIWIVSGGSTVTNPTSYKASAGIAIGGNPQPFQTGIVLCETGLWADGTGLRHGLAMPENTAVEWWFSDGSIGVAFDIVGNVTDLAHKQQILVNNTGFAWYSAGTAGFSLAYIASAVNGIQIRPATTTNGPTIVPAGSDTNITGILLGKGSGGWIMYDGGGGVKFWYNTTGIGFYGTTPIAKPTGVAVTAAGVHAALVSLGLIAA